MDIRNEYGQITAESFSEGVVRALKDHFPSLYPVGDVHIVLCEFDDFEFRIPYETVREIVYGLIPPDRIYRQFYRFYELFYRECVSGDSVDVVDIDNMLKELT